MNFQMPADLMVGVSGVRGRLGTALTPEVVARFAAAFGAYLRDRNPGVRPAVVVARDSRTSGPMFERVVIAALQSVGCDVIAAGLAPTPTALFAVHHRGAAGGIVVTASHNPVEWNALKFASGSGMFLDAGEGEEMRAFLEDRPIPRAPWDGLGRVVPDADAVARHLRAVLDIPFLDLAALRQRRFRVALDCIRGAGAVLLPPLLEALGCEVIGINLEPDGRFPRPPEPTADNLGELQQLVRNGEVDLGMATDPDGDRLALVEERGRAVGEDYTLALAAMLVLRHRSGTVVTNLSTSRILEDVAVRAGVALERAPVGEINVARAMQEVEAVVGGEGNGGVILPDVHLTRDAAVAAALVLQLLLETGRSLGELVNDLPAYAIVKETVPRGQAPPNRSFGLLAEQLGAPQVDRRDGLRLAWPEERSWVHVRASGTEPILRIIAEAPERAAAAALIRKAREALGVPRD